jgi:hypothetical protein
MVHFKKGSPTIHALFHDVAPLPGVNGEGSDR